MIRCPRCRAELRLSSIIAVTTPLPVEVIPGTSLVARDAEPAEEAFDAEKTMTVDPLPKPRPPPPPSSRRQGPPSTDATVLDPSAFGPFPLVPDFSKRPSPDATAFQEPAFLAPAAPVPAYQAPAIIDVDSTAPMSRPPAIALTPPPQAPVAPSAPEPIAAAPRIAVAAQVAPPPRRADADDAPGANPVRERFAGLDASRRRYQLQFVVAVFGSVTLSVLVDALLNTGPFFRTIASLFTVSMAALWVLVVAASAEPDKDGHWSLPQQGLANVFAAWRRIAADRARSKDLTASERTALLGRTVSGIAAPLAVGFELLRFLQLALYGFFGLGGGSALVFNVLSILAAGAALAGFLVARRGSETAAPAT